jgi:hypothetical protein
MNEATEADLDPNKKIVVQGVKGMKSTSFTKKFRNMKAFDKWADSDAAGDFEIQYVMNESLEEAKKPIAYKTFAMGSRRIGARLTQLHDDIIRTDDVSKADIMGEVLAIKKEFDSLAKNATKLPMNEESLEESVKKGTKVSYGAKIAGKLKIKKSSVIEIKGEKIYLDSSAVLNRSDKVDSKDKIKFHHDFVVVESLEEAAKVTYKWYSVKDWKDGDKRYDGIDDLHGEMEDKKFGIIKWGADSPRDIHKDYHIAVPVANVKAIRYMDSNAKSMDMKESAIKRAIGRLTEAKMEDSEVLSAAKALAANGKDDKAKSFGQGLVDFYKKNDSFTPDQVSGLQNIMKNASFQLAKESTGAFVIKAAVAKQKKKKKFEMGDKEYPVTIKDKNAKKIMDEAKQNEYEVGDNVLTKAGGKWLPATISKPMNSSGNYGVKFKHNNKIINTVSSTDQLKSITEENIDEVSKKTLGSYVKKATAQLDKDWDDTKTGKKGMSNNKVMNRFAGVYKARAKGANESFNMNEAFKAGTMEMNNGDKVKVSKQDAMLLNQMIDDLNPRNKKEMLKVAMLDKNGFDEIVGFAREAL